MTAAARSIELAKIAAEAASDKLATEVLAFDVGEQLAIADVFVIATGANPNQINAICDEVEEKLREQGVKPQAREGVKERRWVLLDFGDLVVHVLSAEERAYYSLERLWRDCPVIEL